MADRCRITIPLWLIKAFPSIECSEGMVGVTPTAIIVRRDLSHFETVMAAARLGQSEASLAPRGVTQYVEQQSCVPRQLDRCYASVACNFANRRGVGVICASRQCV